MIKIITAMTNEKVIGKGKVLPWRIKEELAHFKKTTLNNTIIFGQTTYQNIPSLKERTIIVLSNNMSFIPNENDTVLRNLDETFLNQYKGEKNLYVCGGASIYKLFLPYTDELIISYIKHNYVGDVFFPDFDTEQFKLIRSENYSEFVVKYFQRL